MQYKVVKLESKSNDWKVVDLEMGQDSFVHNVSINRTNKKGEIFPNFDSVEVGKYTEGELWESPSSKWYLFAPRQKPQRAPAPRAAAVEKAMEKKEQSIEKFQDRKEESIKLAGAMRDATILTAEWIRQTPFPTEEEIKAYHLAWIKYFLNLGEQPFI